MINGLITMAWKTFQEVNNTGLEGLVSYPTITWTGFTPLFLFSMFIIVLFSTYFGGRRVFGTSSFLGSFATAGFFIAILAYFMSLIEGMIDNYTLSVTVVVAIIGVILLFTVKERI